MPPVAVRMPCETNMPWISSGTVSRRTRIDLLALLGPRHGIVRGEDHLAARRARRRRQPFRHRGDSLPVVRLETRREELIEGLRIDQQNGLFRLEELLRDEVGGDHHRRITGPLPAARLQHEEPLVLDRELEILNVLVVLLEPRRDLAELRVRLRHHLLELANRLRRPDPGDDVLALRVDEELAVELFLASGGVAGEADARPGSVARIAEDHHLDVDGRPDVIGDVVDAAVLDGAGVHPRSEDGVARHLQLLVRVLREFAARSGLDDLLVARNHVTERLLVEVGVESGANGFLDGFKLVLEHVLTDLQHDVPEHLDEAPVAVKCEAPVLRSGLQPLDGLVVQTQIQDGVHHAGHRELRARTHRDEQRILGRAERRVRRFLELLQVLFDLPIDGAGNLGLLLVVDRADLGGDREAGWHREPGVGHLGEARALPAEQILHVPVAVGFAGAEEIDMLANLRIAGCGLRIPALRHRLLCHLNSVDRSLSQ